MTVQLSSLRVAPELDASKYAAGAQQKVAADKAMAASNREVAATATQTDAKIAQSGDVLARLSRQFVDGYASAQRMNSALNSLSRGFDSGKIKMEQAVPILDGILRKYQLAGDASLFMARGQNELAAAVNAANAKLAAQRQLAPANDGSMNFRRTNLGYQGFDVAQGLLAGAPLSMIAAQQGPQIAQQYVGQGGVKALADDLKAMTLGAASAAAGVLGTTGLIATGFGLAAVAAGAYYLATREKAKTLDEALKENEANVRLIGDAYGYAARQAKAMPIIDGRGADLLAAASAQDLRLALTNNTRDVLGDITHRITPGRSAGGYDVANAEFKPFADAIDHLRASAKNGTPDIAGFRDMVTKDWSFDPLNQGLTTTANKLLDMTDTAMRAVEALKQLDRMRAAQYDVYREYGMSRNAAAGSKAAQDENEDRLRADRFGPYGHGIPIPEQRPNDIERLDTDPLQGFMQDFTKSASQQVAGLRDQQAALGLTGAALEEFTFRQQALNAALSKNLELGPDQIAIIEKQAKAYGKAAEALARARLARDLAFERDQMFRSPQDQRIASRQQGAGLAVDLNSPVAQQMRDMAAFADAKDLAAGFLTDFKSELLRNGGDVGKALGTSILNALSKSMDDQLGKLFDTLASWLASAITGQRPGLAGGVATGVGFVANTTLSDLLGGANDNYAPGAVTRAPLGDAGPMALYRSAIKSIESDGSGGYSALGPVLKNGNQALGAYQVMKSNLPSWSQEALGKTLTPDQFLADPGAQDAIFDKQFGKYLTKYGNPQDAASAWFTGGPLSSGANAKDVLGTSGSVYVDKFNAAVQKASSSLGGLDTTVTSTVQSLAGSIGGKDGLASILDGLKPENFQANTTLSDILGAGGGAAAQPSGGSGIFGTLLSFIPKLFGFAGGTDFAPGGLARINELGGEIVDLPRGSRVIPHDVSMRMAANANRPAPAAPAPKIDLHVHVNGASGDEHVRTLARQGAQQAIGEYHENLASGGIGDLQRRYNSQKG